MGYSFYYPPENKVIVARNAEFLENSLIDQEASGSLEDLEIIQEEDTHPSLDTSLNHKEEDLERDKPQSDIVPIRRSTRTRHAPDRMCLYIDAEEHELGDLGEPANYKAALLDPESKKWLNAMNVEIQSMKDNEVWVLVELPPNGKTVGSKWLFKKKTDMDGNVHIYKARLVAKGFTQTSGIDYEETFSPVADIRAIRILIAIAAYYGYEIWQMDVKSAFLNGYLNEETGYVFVLNGGDVDWKSAKQSIFATSSAEAEYIAAFDASKEAVWVKKFIYGLSVVPTIEEPISMYCNNTRAIAIANESGITKGARHFCAKVHYLRERVFVRNSLPQRKAEEIQVPSPKRLNKRRQPSPTKKPTTNRQGGEEQRCVSWTLRKRLHSENLGFVYPKIAFTDRAERKRKARTSSASTTTGFDVKSLSKLMINEYAMAAELEIRRMDQRQKDEALYLSTTDEDLKAVLRARDLLNTTLHQSRQLDFQIHKTSANVSRINHAFPSLETALRDIASRFATSAFTDHVDRALPPLYAAVNVYQVVDELGRLVSSSAHSYSDLNVYLSLLKRYRQALKFLTNTCTLAITWMEDVKRIFDTTTCVSDGVGIDMAHYSIVCKALHLLNELKETEQRSLVDQGILDVAFRELEDDFENILMDHSVPIQVPSSLFSSGDEESDVSVTSPALALPIHVIQNLKAIVTCFSSDNRVDRCMSIYVKVRSTIVQTALQGLDLDYLDMSLSEFDSVQEIEGYVDEWARHLEFIVKHPLELEYMLYDQVFGHEKKNDWFSKIALQSGIQSFIRFGNTITKGKKEAIKLFKLLDVFATLNNLRHDFNRIFGGKPCSEIQTQTRELIRKVVNGACEIFRDLSAQVQLQRLTDPPLDGTLPRLVTFVTEYSEELLDDDYRLVLEQVLEIHGSWYHDTNKFRKGLVSVEVYNLIKSLELNLETWAKRYEDASLSYIFMMNNSCYLSKHLKGTRLGDLMGESWLKRHEYCVEYYATLYLRDSWSKIPTLLTNSDRDVKKRIKGFNEAFDQLYKKQSGWILCDGAYI
nr:exocyst complex component EXO70A1 [Tanacetum cinerariifolium]